MNGKLFHCSKLNLIGEIQMKKSLIFTVALFLLFSLTAHSQVKRVLLEKFTGAWCGWCVDGTYIMDKIIEEHPDRVIGVEHHFGDNMESMFTQVLTGGLGVSGYPSGCVNRKRIKGTITQRRTSWKKYCETQILQTPLVDVNVKYNFNKKTRQLMVKVFAKMLKTVNDSLRFNVLITEDSVSGTGDGWDQTNYLSHCKGYETNPFYKKPKVIVGYQHMKVARAFLGGAWGINGSFKKPAKKDNIYSQDFNIHIPNNWKIKHINIIGIVQIHSNGSKEILNCNYATKDKSSISLYSNEDGKGVGYVNKSFDRKFVLQNLSSKTKTFDFRTTKSKRTPTDWTIAIPELTKNEIILEAGKSFNFTLKMKPGNTVGIGDAQVIVEENGETNALKGIGTITTFSSKINKMEIIPTGEMSYQISSLLKEMGHNNFFQITQEDYALVGTKLNPKILIWNFGENYEPKINNMSTIKKALNSNIPIFICGNNSIYGLMMSGILKQNFFCSFNGYSTQGTSTPTKQVWFSSATNDIISGPLGNSIEATNKNEIYLLKIDNKDKCLPFFHLKNDGKRTIFENGKEKKYDVKGKDAIFGVRVDNGKSRSVLMTNTPYSLKDNNARKTLVDRIIRWLNHDKTLPVAENAEISEFTVAPIPARDNITFNFCTAMNSTIRIYNSMGMLVDEINDLNTGNMYSYNTSSLSSGVYTAIWNNGNLRQLAKFTIVK